MVVDAWPLFRLRIVTPRLELRLIPDDELDALVDAARQIEGAPGVFLGDWASQPDPAFRRGIAQFQWRARALWSPDDWQLPLGVFRNDTLLGVQDIGATNFSVLREVSTGSWLSTPFAGDGVGTEMRAAVLQLAFEGLDAEIARSSARESNVSSQRVSEKLGYRHNGTIRTVFGDGVVAGDLAFEMTKEEWVNPLPEIRIKGLDDCRELFGA